MVAGREPREKQCGMLECSPERAQTFVEDEEGEACGGA